MSAVDFERAAVWASELLREIEFLRCAAPKDQLEHAVVLAEKGVVIAAALTNLVAALGLRDTRSEVMSADFERREAELRRRNAELQAKLDALETCVVCEARLVLFDPETPPYCVDCFVDEEQAAKWAALCRKHGGGS